MKKINYYDVTVDYLNNYGIYGKECNDIIVDDDTDITEVYYNLSNIDLQSTEKEGEYTYTDESGEEHIVIVISEKQIEEE